MLTFVALNSGILVGYLLGREKYTAAWFTVGVAGILYRLAVIGVTGHWVV